MNQLMLISKSLNLGLDERLKEDSLAVINSAKVLTKEYHYAHFQIVILFVVVVLFIL